MKYPIILVEVPHRGDPTAYICRDSADLARAAEYECGDGEWYERTTVAELMDIDPDFDPVVYSLACQDYPAAGNLRSLPGRSVLYRADYYTGDAGHYCLETIEQDNAAIACIGHDLSSLRVVDQDGLMEELAYLEGPNAPRIGQCGPWVAAQALRRQAIKEGWLVLNLKP